MTRVSRADPAGLALELSISPSGRLSLEHEHEYEHDAAGASGAVPTSAAAARIRQAFQRGSAHGLLQLGAVELDTALPSSLAFGRELAHLFMTRLTAVTTLTDDWASVDVNAPRAELAQLAAAAPPMIGAEYLATGVLEAWWGELLPAAREQIAAQGGDVSAWLQSQHPSWSLVGRVCFHLAENKGNEQAPFAFLATCASHVSRDARVQHVPLGRALRQYADAQDRAGMLKLLLPVHKAAGQSPWLQAMVDAGTVFQPQAWSPAEAHRFLRNVPAFEASGLVVRIPDWWQPRHPPRPQVRVNLGQQAAGLGLDTMLDFDVQLTLDGEVLTAEEWQQLATAGEGLVRLKGRWVELDRDKLDAVLAHWKEVQRSAADDGVSFLEGMRLLAGASLEAGADATLAETTAEWSSVVAGDWLRNTLAQMREPGESAASDPQPELKAHLRPYQRSGVHWLWWLHRLGLGGCLADDMGLGKTVQVLGLLSLAKREGDAGPHLLVVPASLIANWQAEAARFAPQLRLLIAHASAMPAKELAALPAQRLADVDVVVTSYGSVSRLAWLAQQRWSLLVLDEAQAIKNPGAQQTRKIKALKSRVRFALTGTPVENRLGDLWSLFDFICPGLLGSAATFNGFVRRLAANEHADYAPLRRLVQPYILRRLKSDKRVIADLPDKAELKAYCALSKVQASLYQQSVDALAEQIATLDGMARRGVVLAFLMRFKQICNHPSQWLGDGRYAPPDSGKFARLRELAEAVAARQEKLLVFTQFQEVTGPLSAFLQGVFGRAGLVLHGGTAVKARAALVEAFQREQGPPFFVLSLKAGGTGLNLTAASHVVHFDRWWNPAVENQATDRAYRIGQKKNVLVHKFVCRGTVEERIDALVEAKLGLSKQIIEGGGEALLTELSNDDLLRLVALDIGSAMDEGKAA
ncbi:DEAD/DEAH box helicase [Aquabacterium sp.]|uniref:DEAD/DEAH box helicase n=1 Tax=Aquabacterium sp. TaxID=1872578 RepID=UPI002C1EE271|nr:DEAD/DEAH box helicase [Aquabacterium sp.]HSW08636.1 DEAD/DEAH box helicase [Aquabacterium sp.]